MPDQEEKISDIKVPGPDAAETGQDTLNVMIHYEAGKDDLSQERGIDITLGKGRILALIGDADLDRVTFRLPVTNLEKIGITMVFQDPLSVLDPSHSIIDQTINILMIHQHLSRKAATEKAHDILRAVGLSDTTEDNYPHEFSDEMKQRVVIAAALAHAPKLLIANETASGLDLNVKLQLLTLLRGIVHASDMAMLIMTKDTSLAAQVSDDIAVL